MKCPLCGAENKTARVIGRHSFFACRVCGLMYSKDLEADKTYYQDYFERTRGHKQKANALRAKQYLIDAGHFSGHLPKGTILDVGCSAGGFMKALDSAGRYQMDGIDLDCRAVSSLARKNPCRRARFFHTDLVHFTSPLQYDAVIFRGTFQYLGNELMGTIRKCRKILKKNGLVVIYCLPNSDSFIFHLLKEKWGLFNPDEHRLIFNARSIQYLCDTYGFVPVEVSYPYLDTAYSNRTEDYKNVVRIISSGQTVSPPFWGNIMQIVMRKR